MREGAELGSHSLPPLLPTHPLSRGKMFWVPRSRAFSLLFLKFREEVRTEAARGRRELKRAVPASSPDFCQRDAGSALGVELSRVGVDLRVAIESP